MIVLILSFVRLYAHVCVCAYLYKDKWGLGRVGVKAAGFHGVAKTSRPVRLCWLTTLLPP